MPAAVNKAKIETLIIRFQNSVEAHIDGDGDVSIENAGEGFLTLADVAFIERMMSTMKAER